MQIAPVARQSIATSQSDKLQAAPRVKRYVLTVVGEIPPIRCFAFIEQRRKHDISRRQSKQLPEVPERIGQMLCHFERANAYPILGRRWVRFKPARKYVLRITIEIKKIHSVIPAEPHKKTGSRAPVQTRLSRPNA